MAKKDLYKYDDLIFKRTDGNTYSSDPQTNNQRARSKYLAEHQGARDLASSLAAQNEVNAYDALQLAAWQASQNQTTPTQKPDPTPAYSGTYTGGGTVQATQTPEPWNPQIGGVALGTGAAPAVSSFSYDPAPEYISPYQAQIDEALNAYLNRGPFSYDPATDPQYAAYRKQYAREGQRATADTLGQLAAMTGGMPSSYAVTAAQQAGDYYAAQMADKIPELYQAAYQMYADEGNRMLSGLNALRGVESDAYNRYLTRLGQYNTDRSFDEGLWRYGVDDARYADETAYERNLALAQLAAGTGDYRGLRALGIDTSTAEAKARAGSGGGGSRSSSSSASDEDLEAAAARYGLSIDEAKKLLSIGDERIDNSPAMQEFYASLGIDVGDDGSTSDAVQPTITNHSTENTIIVPGLGGMTWDQLYTLVEQGYVEPEYSDDGKQVTFKYYR